MTFRDKIGCSTKRDSLEDALTWAAAKDYHFLEFNANRGDIEGDLRPGEGNIDFASLFRRLQSSGYTKRFNLKFGARADEFAARDELAKLYDKKQG